MVIGGVPVSAFPNVGVNLKHAIQKLGTELNKQKELGGFKFGILGSVEFKTVNHRFQSLPWSLTRALTKAGESEVIRGKSPFTRLPSVAAAVSEIDVNPGITSQRSNLLKAAATSSGTVEKAGKCPSH